MQMTFGFGAVEDIAWMRNALRSGLGRPGPVLLRTPIGQLVKSSISSRTRDEVSFAAYEGLVARYSHWSELAAAPVGEIETVIGDVTFPDVKARYLSDALNAVAADRPDFDLTFLTDFTVARALAWLERLPGVGRKVSASTLNFSTLQMPAFVVDTHILRVLRRFGFVRAKAGTEAAYTAVMAVTDGWTAGDLAELHILMKRLGQTTCRSDGAVCAACPISRRCRKVEAECDQTAAAPVNEANA